jgi:hypothetical protein
MLKYFPDYGRNIRFANYFLALLALESNKKIPYYLHSKFDQRFSRITYTNNVKLVRVTFPSAAKALRSKWIYSSFLQYYSRQRECQKEKAEK